MNTQSGTPDLVRTAARNNAELCELVCSAHEVGGEFADDTWISARRTPQYYPDAVTLEPHVEAETVLERIDDSPGASVKDSFATLDLSGFGFRVLFDADWIARRPAPQPETREDLGAQWSVIEEADALTAWEIAWSEDGIARGRFAPQLLQSPELDFLCRRVGDDIVAGAIVNRSRDAVGVSNVFFLTGAPAGAWAGLAGEIDTWCPDLPTVGYEADGLIGGARRVGFEPIGPLRIWIKD